MEGGAQTVLVRSGQSWRGAVGQVEVEGETEGGGAAEEAGGGPAVRVVVLGGEVVIPEAVTIGMSAPWNTYISI